MGKNNKNQENDYKEQHEPERSSDFEFLQERIKERPINKKKLIRRTIITASMAVLFGVLACLSFAFLEPVLNNWLYPEEEPGIVTFPQEQDEMLPEDMLTEGSTASVQATVYPLGNSNVSIQVTDEDVTNVQDDDDATNESETETQTGQEEALPIESYITQYDELYKVYEEVYSSMVTVTGVRSDVDWFNNPYQSEGSTAGVIIANNNKELLILSRKSPLDKAQTININFGDETSAQAQIKKYDSNTDLAVLAVDLKDIKSSTLDYVTVATLGSSSSSSITGTPIIAVGNIYGYSDSVSYGIITSMGNSISIPDNDYKLLTTDIYAGENPTGILVNMDKEVIGIIDNRYNKDETKNLLSAIGITELKGMVTKLSNGDEVPYLGIYVQDISQQVRKELGLPNGAYIYDMDKDSDVIQNGLQKGDIIVKFGLNTIENSSDYMNALRNVSIDRSIKIIVKRASLDDYQEMEIMVMPTEK
jgi:serine protease Do